MKSFAGIFVFVSLIILVMGTPRLQAQEQRDTDQLLELADRNADGEVDDGEIEWLVNDLKQKKKARAQQPKATKGAGKPAPARGQTQGAGRKPVLEDWRAERDYESAKRRLENRYELEKRQLETEYEAQKRQLELRFERGKQRSERERDFEKEQEKRDKDRDKEDD